MKKLGSISIITIMALVLLLATFSLVGCDKNSPVIVDDELEPHTVHTYSSWTYTKTPTCVLGGEKTRNCTICNETQTISVAASGHSYGEWVVSIEPTQTAEGKKEKTCKKCGDVISETIPKHEHSFSEWIIESQPSCLEAGLSVRECECGERQEKPISALDHDLSIQTVNADCTTKGYTRKSCSRCYFEQDISIVEPLGHDYNETGYCTRCDIHQSSFLDYQLIEDGTAYEIVGMGGLSVESLTILSTYNELPVTSIAGSAINSEVISITIPDSITHIASTAFSACSNLQYESVDGALYLGKWLVSATTELDTVFVRQGTVGILGYAFSQARQLKMVHVPQSVEYIEEYAFCNLNNCILYLECQDEKSGFADNWNFNNCCEAYFGYVADGVYYNNNQQSDSYVYIVTQKELVYSAVIISYTGTNLGTDIPQQISFELEGETQTATVTTIAPYAFYQCKDIVMVTFPNTITSIGSFAFSGCTKLQTINNFPSVDVIAKNCFASCKALTSFTVKEGVTSIMDGAFGYCTALGSITLPSTLSYIGDSALRGNIALTEITIPLQVEHIGAYCFADCTLLSITALAKSQPQGWSELFNYSACTITWAE